MTDVLGKVPEQGSFRQALNLLEKQPVLCDGMVFPVGSWSITRAATIAAIWGRSSRSEALAEALEAWKSLEVPPEGAVVPAGPWNRARETAIEAIRGYLTASGLRLPPRTDRCPQHGGKDRG